MTYPFINEIIESITYSQFLIKFRAFEDISFPETYKGESYRGCFSKAFIKLVCRFKVKPECVECCDRFDCSFYKFSTNELTSPHPFFGNKTFPPKSYIINPDYNPSKQICRGDLFQFELILIGEAIEQFTPLLDPIIRLMGELGIGIGRRKFKPLPLEYLNKSGKYERLPENGLPIILKLSDLEVKPVNRHLTLHFETPVRFMSDEKEVKDEPTFDEFIKRLYIRLGDLSYLYCNFKKFDFEIETEKFNFQIQCTHNGLKRDGFISHSINGKEKGEKANKTYKGHVGMITFTGEINPWAKLLSAGEILHVGSTATFGFGKYRIIPDE